MSTTAAQKTWTVTLRCPDWWTSEEHPPEVTYGFTLESFLAAYAKGGALKTLIDHAWLLDTEREEVESCD